LAPKRRFAAETPISETTFLICPKFPSRAKDASGALSVTDLGLQSNSASFRSKKYQAKAIFL
jgi:hypothetical protein